MMKMSFTDFPREMHDWIFPLIKNDKDLLNFSSTCKLFFEIGNEEIENRLYLEYPAFQDREFCEILFHDLPGVMKNLFPKIISLCLHNPGSYLPPVRCLEIAKPEIRSELLSFSREHKELLRQLDDFLEPSPMIWYRGVKEDIRKAIEQKEFSEFAVEFIERGVNSLENQGLHRVLEDYRDYSFDVIKKASVFLKMYDSLQKSVVLLEKCIRENECDWGTQQKICGLLDGLLIPAVDRLPFWGIICVNAAKGVNAGINIWEEFSYLDSVNTFWQQLEQFSFSVKGGPDVKITKSNFHNHLKEFHYVCSGLRDHFWTLVQLKQRVKLPWGIKRHVKCLKNDERFAHFFVTNRKIARIYIEYNPGYGNQLYIRGEEYCGGETGLNWNRGRLLKNIGPDGWVWETRSLPTGFKFKVLINDKQYEGGADHTYWPIKHLEDCTYVVGAGLIPRIKPKFSRQ